MALTGDRVLDLRSNKADGLLLSASCHTSDELDKAVRIGSDFVVLSPVQKTASHPDMEPMGWKQFSEMVRSVQVPVYALGGVSETDIETAWTYGGQGVAAISAYWKS
jgi:8-oxo-dGTP diphosphatase